MRKCIRRCVCVHIYNMIHDISIYIRISISIVVILIIGFIVIIISSSIIIIMNIINIYIYMDLGTLQEGLPGKNINFWTSVFLLRFDRA